MDISVNYLLAKIGSLVIELEFLRNQNQELSKKVIDLEEAAKPKE